MTTAEVLTEEREGPRGISIEDIISRPVEFTPDVLNVVNKIIGGQTNTKNDFDIVYWNSTEYIKKFQLARALIEDGRLPQDRQKRLLDNFFMPGGRISTEPEHTDDERLKGQLKDHLRLLLIDKGVIKSDPAEASEKEAEENEETLLRIVRNDETLNRLLMLLPIEVMTDVTTTLLFADMPDEQKRRHRQMFVARSLIRAYLGDITVYQGRGDVSFQDLFAAVPERIFEDKYRAVLGVVREYYEDQALNLFGDDPEEIGFARLKAGIDLEASPTKKQFLEDVDRQFRADLEYQIPPEFKRTIESWEGKQSVFPTMRQRRVAAKFSRRYRDFVEGGVGSGKTSLDYLIMHGLGRKRVLVIGPAKARNTWPEQAEKHFKEGVVPDVFTVQSRHDLANPRVLTANYLYISSQLLSDAYVAGDDSEENRTASQRLRDQIWTTVVNGRRNDAVTIDEAHVFRNPVANCTQVFLDLISDIAALYEPKFGVDTTLPILALTATPADGDLAHLDVMFGILYPDRFSVPSRERPGLLTFSQTSLKDPQLAHSLIRGGRLITRFSARDIFGDRVVQPEIQVRRLEMTPYQNVIYEWIAGLTEPMARIGVLEKTDLLTEVLLNPELVKEKLRQKGWIPATIRSRSGLMSALAEYYQQWRYWSEEYRDPRIPYEPFSADWIAKIGGEAFLLECFFSQELVSGVDSLVFQLDLGRKQQDLVRSWKVLEAPSPKFLELKRFITDRVRREGNNNFFADERIIVVSPIIREGITRHLEDADDEALRNNTFSLYENIIYDWLSGLPPNMAVSVDGGRTFRYRDRVAEASRTHGSDGVITVATMPSINESRDWAPRDTVDNQNIKRMSMHFLGWAWGPSPMDQMIGRGARPGLGKKFNVFVYETIGTIEEGLRDLVRWKRLTNRLVLSGVPLSEGDRSFYDRANAARRILIARPNIDQFFIRGAIRRLRGGNETDFEKELSKVRDGISNYERWARAYFQEGRDEFGVAGNNAEFVTAVFTNADVRRLLVVGAGTCLLNRKIIANGYEGIIVDNIDPNEYAMRLAKERYPEIGNIWRGWVSHLGVADESYDGLDCSLVLDLLSPEMRVQSLREINRAIAIGGKVVITLPESALNRQTFAIFAQGLETQGGGFKVLTEASGVIFAHDIKPKKLIGWAIALEKTGTMMEGALDPNNLSLLTDPQTRVSHYKPEDPDKPPEVIEVEYPVFSSRSFEIVNPLTGEHSYQDSQRYQPGQIHTDGNSDSESPGNGFIVVPPRLYTDHLTAEDIRSFTRGLTREQFTFYRGLLRYVERRLDSLGQAKPFEERNLLLARILAENGLSNPETWSVSPVERLLNRAITRQFSQN